MTDRELLQQALDELEDAGGYSGTLMKAIEERLAQPQQCRTDGRCQYAIDHGAEGLKHCPQGKCCMPVEQEPVAWLHHQGNFADPSYRQLDDYERARGWTEQPLYIAPPQRQPLTDELIDAIAREAQGKKSLIWIARAIEAAHNIG